MPDLNRWTGAAWEAFDPGDLKRWTGTEWEPVPLSFYDGTQQVEALPAAGSAFEPIQDPGNLQGTYVDYSSPIFDEPGVAPEAHGAAGDGVTDDTAAFVAAVENNNHVTLQEDSTYLLGGQAWVRNINDVVIDGGGTITIPDANWGNYTYAIRFSGSNIHLDGITLDGNTANTGLTGAVQFLACDNVSVRNCEVKNWLDHDGITDEPHVLAFQGSTNGEILDNYIHDIGSKGVSWYANSGDPVPNNVVMARNRTERTGEEGLFAGNEMGTPATGIHIVYNDVGLTRSQYGIRIGGATPIDVQITDNLVTDSVHAGITVKTLGATTALVERNELCRCGINFRATNDAAPVSGTVRGNVLKHTTHGVQSLSACENVTVENNYTYGITFDGGTVGLVAQNNHIGAGGVTTVNGATITDSGNTADYDHTAHECTLGLPLTTAAASYEPGGTSVGKVGSESYETITLAAGETRSVAVRTGDVYQNKLIDVSADGADFHIDANGDDFVIRNIGIKGVADNTNDLTGYSNYIRCQGNGLIENIYLADGHENGLAKGAIGSSYAHAGHIEFRNMNVNRFAGNAVYAAGAGRINPPGQTDGGGGSYAFVDSLFTNNNIAHFRLASDGSSLTNVTMYNTGVVPPHPDSGNVVNSRGMYTGYGDPSQTIWVRNCDVELTDANTNGASSAFVSDTHAEYGDLTVIDIDDTEVIGDLIGAFVQTGPNVGAAPDLAVPRGVPTSAEEAASGGGVP